MWHSVQKFLLSVKTFGFFGARTQAYILIWVTLIVHYTMVQAHCKHLTFTGALLGGSRPGPPSPAATTHLFCARSRWTGISCNSLGIFLILETSGIQFCATYHPSVAMPVGLVLLYLYRLWRWSSIYSLKKSIITDLWRRARQKNKSLCI